MQGCGVRVEFQQPPDIAYEKNHSKRLAYWKQSKQLQVGSLVCLIMDLVISEQNQRPRMFFATVAHREELDLVGHHAAEG